MPKDIYKAHQVDLESAICDVAAMANVCVLLMEALEKNERSTANMEITAKQAAGHLAADGVVNDQRWNGIEDGGGHQQIPGRLIARQELAQCDRHSYDGAAGQQQERVQVFVPGQQQRIGADGDQRGCHQR